MRLLLVCLLGCIATASAVSIADVIHEEFKSFMVSNNAQFRIATAWPIRRRLVLHAMWHVACDSDAGTG